MKKKFRRVGSQGLYCPRDGLTEEFHSPVGQGTGKESHYLAILGALELPDFPDRIVITTIQW